jgi:WD40 repeat protein
LTGHTAPIALLATLADGNSASGSNDNNVNIWNTKTASILFKLVGHADSIQALATLSNVNLASDASDATVYNLTGPQNALVNVLSGLGHGTVKIWH